MGLYTYRNLNKTADDGSRVLSYTQIGASGEGMSGGNILFQNPLKYNNLNIGYSNWYYDWVIKQFPNTGTFFADSVGICEFQPSQNGTEVVKYALVINGKESSETSELRFITGPIGSLPAASFYSSQPSAAPKRLDSKYASRYAFAYSPTGLAGAAAPITSNITLVYGANSTGQTVASNNASAGIFIRTTGNKQAGINYSLLFIITPLSTSQHRLGGYGYNGSPSSYVEEIAFNTDLSGANVGGALRCTLRDDAGGRFDFGFNTNVLAVGGTYTVLIGLTGLNTAACWVNRVPTALSYGSTSYTGSSSGLIGKLYAIGNFNYGSSESLELGYSSDPASAPFSLFARLDKPVMQVQELAYNPWQVFEPEESSYIFHSYVASTGIYDILGSSKDSMIQEEFRGSNLSDTIVSTYRYIYDRISPKPKYNSKVTVGYPGLIFAAGGPRLTSYMPNKQVSITYGSGSRPGVAATGEAFLQDATQATNSALLPADIFIQKTLTEWTLIWSGVINSLPAEAPLIAQWNGTPTTGCFLLSVSTAGAVIWGPGGVNCSYIWSGSSGLVVPSMSRATTVVARWRANAVHDCYVNGVYQDLTNVASVSNIVSTLDPGWGGGGTSIGCKVDAGVLNGSTNFVASISRCVSNAEAQALSLNPTAYLLEPIDDDNLNITNVTIPGASSVLDIVDDTNDDVADGIMEIIRGGPAEVARPFVS